VPPEAGPPPIEDYALIGDGVTGALVNRSGGIDWLCWPRFDSSACFAAILGTSEHGTWLIAPADAGAQVRRCYRGASLVLETVFSSADGEVALIDFMPVGRDRSSVVRLVQGRRGRVAMRMRLALRFGYGAIAPWLTPLPDGSGVVAIAGPDLVVLRTPVHLESRDFSSVAAFDVAEGETVPFVLTYTASHDPPPPPVEPTQALAATEAFWRDWSAGCTYRGPYQQAVQRSLITIKGLVYAPTGAMVAAPTTSLPEYVGGTRNWDYRYCWLRDAALTLQAFMGAGHVTEAQAWCNWLQRSLAGRAAEMRVIYGLSGERRVAEWEAEWLPGYHGARPVRIGNAASDQLQLDVFGEVMAVLHEARLAGAVPPHLWELQCALIEHLETVWEQPDEGIWEVRGGRWQFTFSKMMAWVAFDRAIASAEQFGLPAPLERWRGVRASIHQMVCERGFDAALDSFVQVFGGKEIDASVLLLAGRGFLPDDDPRMIGTVKAIERDLLSVTTMRRYASGGAVEGLPPGEGAFLPCSLWLAEAYAHQGRRDDARALFERLLALGNDVGLFAEEYDVTTGHHSGNFPQALTHAALIRCALALDPA
jgi:GH15 family glucan-1,4-alpha-glucosidase